MFKPEQTPTRTYLLGFVQTPTSPTVSGTLRLKSHIGPVSFPNAKECFLLQKTAYRRANGGSTAPSLHEVWGYHRDITHGVIVPHGAPKNRARLPFLTGSGPSLYSGKNASLSHLAEDGALGWKTSLSLMLLVCAGIGLSYASTM